MVKNISSNALILLKIEDPHIIWTKTGLIFEFHFTSDDMPVDDSAIYEKKIYRTKLLMPNEVFKLNLPGAYRNDKKLNITIMIGIKVLAGGEIFYSYSEPSQDIFESQKIVTQQVHCY